jgi:hypothetical protein
MLAQPIIFRVIQSSGGLNREPPHGRLLMNGPHLRYLRALASSWYLGEFLVSWYFLGFLLVDRGKIIRIQSKEIVVLHSSRADCARTSGQTCSNTCWARLGTGGGFRLFKVRAGGG